MPKTTPSEPVAAKASPKDPRHMTRTELFEHRAKRAGRKKSPRGEKPQADESETSEIDEDKTGNDPA